MSGHEELQQADVETKIHTLQASEVDKCKSPYSRRSSTPCSHVQKIGEGPRHGIYGCKRQPLTSLADCIVL